MPAPYTEVGGKTIEWRNKSRRFQSIHWNYWLIQLKQAPRSFGDRRESGSSTAVSSNRRAKGAHNKRRRTTAYPERKNRIYNGWRQVPRNPGATLPERR